jgi:CHAT domain-containing protein/Tfp pilus assembly protein PilF
LNNFGAFYQDIGDFEQAEKLLQRSLAIREKTLKPDHPLIAISLNNLGLLYTDKGDYEQAERIHQRGLAIREKVLGNDHPETAISLNNLSIVYSKKGDYTRAQQLSARSLASREKVFGANHPIVAVSLNTLAGIYYQQGKQTEAIPLFQRSIAIEEKVLGPDHLTLAPNINNLALAYAQQGDLVQATTLLERSLAIREKALGSEHPLVAVALSNLAFIYQDRQAYAQAEDYFQRSLKIYERVFGDTHPDIATIYDNLAGLYELQQRMTEAIAARVKCNEVRERELLRNLAPGSENQKLKYLAVSGSELDATLTLHLQAAPQDPTIGAAALTIALRRKGRALDAMTNALSNLRRLASEEDRQLLDRLATVRSEITVQLNKIGEQGTKLTAQIQQLQQQAEELEAQISNRSAELRHQLQLQHTPINLDKVQQAIPRNTALVEFVIYRPVTRANLPKDTKYSAPHYAAYLLQSQGHPLAVDLGPVAEIDQAASALRKALIKQPGKALSNLAKNVKPCARQLDKLIMQPIRQLLNQNDLAGQNRLTRLLISPDGNLNLVPFDALVDEHQRFLVERYEISYLTSGRDLLRQQSMENTSENNESHESNENNDPKTTKITKNTLTNQTTNTLAVVILANPDYGNGQGPVLLGLQANPLKQLRGAASEGTQLQRQLPQARLLQGREASETIMRTLQRPTILHIATHGYFLQYPSGNQADNDKDNANEKDRTNEVELVDNKSVSDKLFGKQAINNLADIDKLALNVNAQRALVLESQDPIAIDPALLRQTNPLLRSYLFFAGANSGQLGNAPQTTTSQTTAPQTTILQSAVTQNNVASNDNDGVMTALDIAGLNLLGTKLVVLSACDTGLGEVRNGDGVYGLRRALVLAGAESQMISLWPVADRATRELMVNYYQTLRLGKGRSAGLRAVRLKMLHDPRRRHPYYWASFIQSGEWGKLTDK